MTQIFPYKNKTYDSDIWRKNTDQQKPVFSDILRKDMTNKKIKDMTTT